ADQSNIYFNLGLCYRNLEQPQEAARAWQECLKPGGGPESQSASFYLGELRLHEQSYEQAVRLLSESVASVGKPLVWKNPIVSLQNARDLFEKALKQLRQVARFDLAEKLVNAYASISAPRRILRLQGESNLEWGRALQETEKQNPDNLKNARVRYQAAGEAYSKLVELPGLPVAEQGEFVWTAAQAFILAQATDQAIQRLEQAVKQNLEPQRLGEAWFRLAELYRGKGKKAESLAAFGKCMEHDTRFAYLARFQLAMARLEAGDLDEAEAALVYNLTMLRWESDPEAMSQSLFALGSLLYKRRDYRRVVRYLEDALGRFQDNPEVTKARFQLADSYRQIAAQENQSYLLGETMSAETRSHFQREHRRWLQKAADEFAALDRLLETEAGKQHFNAEMRAQVPFISAKCWFNLGQYEKSLTVYEKLIDRYLGKVEVLDALGGAVSCHAALGQVDKVKQRLLQIKTTLPKIEEPVRGPWERWLVEALKPLSEL
ncbi:MAG: tetratricopeptide repeat protein, partial [Gemmataceae bacterium]